MNWINLSPRANRFLATARRDNIERDPAVIAEKLTLIGRPVWPCVLAFEQTYGGLWWPAGSDRDQLGIYYDPPLEDGADPLSLDLTQVPIGAIGVLGLFMNEVGIVTVQPYTRHASIEVFLERLALERLPRLTTLAIQSPAGEHLAAALGAQAIAEATDRYQAWWSGDDLLIRHERPSEPGYPISSESQRDTIYANSQPAIARTKEAAEALGISVSEGNMASWGDG